MVDQAIGHVEKERAITARVLLDIADTLLRYPRIYQGAVLQVVQLKAVAMDVGIHRARAKVGQVVAQDALPRDGGP